MSLYYARFSNRLISAPALTVADAVARYLKEKSRKRTIADDGRHLRRLARVFGPDTPLAAVSASGISGWKAEMLAATSPKTKRPYSPAAINRPLAVLRHLLRLAHEEWETLSVVPRIKLVTEGEGRVVWLDPARETELLAASKQSRNPELFLLVLLAVETGMRRSEILGLTWERIDLSRSVLVLSSRSTKSERRRESPCARSSTTGSRRPRAPARAPYSGPAAGPATGRRGRRSPPPSRPLRRASS